MSSEHDVKAFCEFELKTFFHFEKLENYFGSLELVLDRLRTFECHCVLLCMTLLTEEPVVCHLSKRAAMLLLV